MSSELVAACGLFICGMTALTFYFHRELGRFSGLMKKTCEHYDREIEKLTKKLARWVDSSFVIGKIPKS